MYNQQQQQQHHSEWKSRSQQPPPPGGSWPGHHPYHSQVAGSVPGMPPHVHRPAPPPIHCPSHHSQHRQQHHHYHVGAGAGGHAHHHYAHHRQHQSAYYHGHRNTTSSPVGHHHHPSTATSQQHQRQQQQQHQRPEMQRSMHRMRHAQPILVSPSSHTASCVTSSPISPQTIPSSASSTPREAVVVVDARSRNNSNSNGSNRKLTTPGGSGGGAAASATQNATAAAVTAVATAVTPNSHSSAANNVITTKPPRPYTEYTMFYQLEREFILHRILTTDQERAAASQNPMTMDSSSPSSSSSSSLSPGENNNNGHHHNQIALFQNDPLMPARYRSLPLRADWYISGKSKKPTKRKHRKSHGKIGFLELTRMIAARWAKVDDETRKYCKMMAAMELVKYKEDMESYNLYKERLSAIGEIPEDMKERILKKQRAQEKKDASKKNKEGGAGAVVGSNTGSGSKKRATSPAIKADVVKSNIPTTGTATSTQRRTSSLRTPTMKAHPTTTVKFEPIAHDSPHQMIQVLNTTLDNDMEEFITSLVHDTPVAKGKTITPERSSKKRRLFRDRNTAATIVSRTAAAAATTASDGTEQEMHGPLKDDDDHLDGIKMAFSGIDENEIERELSGHVYNNHNADGNKTAITAGTMRRTGSGPGPGGGMKADPSFDYWDVLVESPTQL